MCRSTQSEPETEDKDGSVEPFAVPDGIFSAAMPKAAPVGVGGISSVPTCQPELAVDHATQQSGRRFGSSCISNSTTP